MKTAICRLALCLASATMMTPATAGMIVTGQGPINLYATAQRSSTFDGCKELFPGGRPIPLTLVSVDWAPRGLCSDSFAVLYSGRSKTPLVVVERLNRQQVDDAGEVRTNQFFPDPRLPASERAYLDDYKGSGYGVEQAVVSPAAILLSENVQRWFSVRRGNPTRFDAHVLTLEGDRFCRGRGHVAKPVFADTFNPPNRTSSQGW